MIRVLIVDDHPIVRDGLEVLLASEKGISIHGTAASAEEAVALCEKKGAPDVVVTDVHMPGGMTGLELAARLKKTCPSARVLLLAGMPLKAEVDEARAGRGRVSAEELEARRSCGGHPPRRRGAGRLRRGGVCPAEDDSFRARSRYSQVHGAWQDARRDRDYSRHRLRDRAHPHEEPHCKARCH